MNRQSKVIAVANKNKSRLLSIPKADLLNPTAIKRLKSIKV